MDKNKQINPNAVESKIEKVGSKAKYQVKELVYTHLRYAILSGDLLPGETLHESALVKQFGASRSPIREALVQLEQEGLVITIPKKEVSLLKLINLS
jgi:DNA-binding GntR family transcriptional regulator